MDILSPDILLLLALEVMKGICFDEYLQILKYPDLVLKDLMQEYCNIEISPPNFVEKKFDNQMQFS